MDIAGDVTFSVRRGLISRGTAVVAVGIAGLSQITASVVLVGPDIRAIEIGIGGCIGIARNVAVSIGTGLIRRCPSGRAVGVGGLRQIAAGVIFVRPEITTVKICVGGLVGIPSNIAVGISRGYCVRITNDNAIDISGGLAEGDFGVVALGFSRFDQVPAWVIDVEELREKHR